MDESSWDSFLEDVSVDSHPMCVFGKYIGTLPHGAQKDVAAALADKKVSSNKIFQELTRRGMKLGRTTVQIHRNEGCPCFRKDLN